ncbi:MAG: hypothetical protein RBT46_01095 [Weeksellaceae bacterium]|jgi:hypothetical protein|nr:hypothetical protein [Weeksellaceae bacterium]
MATYCTECGDKIIGRADKKFCNDSCRNTYNNRQNKDSSNLMKKINRQLRINYNIVSALNFKENKVKLKRQALQDLHFNFDYFTHLKIYKNGSEYRFLYNIGYRFLDDDWILIVKTE